MAKLNLAPTKSNLVFLKRQLAFAREGYDLLEQKRQILMFELISRLQRARDTELQVGKSLRECFAALREAELDIGSEALDRAALAVSMKHEIELEQQRLMGLRISRITVKTERPGIQFGVGGTTWRCDQAAAKFVEALRVLAELAELENAVLRVARELRKTQRRCNALSKILIPNFVETLAYIAGTLEERERESFIIQKLIRNRLYQTEPTR